MAKKKRKNQYQFLTRQFSKMKQKRLAILFILVLLVFGILLGRVIYINVVHGEEYQKTVLDQQSYDSRTIPFKRGDIVDTNGTTLATSERVYSVILDVKNLLATTETELAIEQTTAVLVDVFGISEEDIATAIEERSTSQYVILQKYVDYDTAQLFELYEEISDMSVSEYEELELEEEIERYPYLTGVWLEEGYIRSYPYDTLASNIIGFSGSSNVGVGGVEQYYDDTLNGVDGKEYGYFYGSSTEVTVEAAENGNTVVMTIDQNLQSIVEKYITLFNETYTDNYTEGAGSATTAVVIADPNTGAILASATYPNYDLNNPSDLTAYYTDEEISAMTTEETSEALNTMWTNFVVSSTFEPGSPVKAFTLAAALETGAIDGTETYTCTGGLQIGTDYISCVNVYGHGVLTVEEALSVSCNSALMQIADQIGIIDFTTYQSLFGFGQTTGIDLPGEAVTSGLIYTSTTMSYIDLMTNSFGQSFNVTMIQMVAAFNALVNGGDYYEPYVVEQIQDSSGNVIENIEPTLVKKVVSESTSDTVKSYLESVVSSGTGSTASVEGYNVGGKTGTAEKLPRGNECYVVSFIGAVPIDDPEIVIYVVIDEPNVEEQASSSYAQQLAADIMEEALPYLGVTTIAETEE
ncbi:MAG: penicillin-binding transpeptidase domain-containing protein [Eubacteriales bacterium]